MACLLLKSKRNHRNGSLNTATFHLSKNGLIYYAGLGMYIEENADYCVQLLYEIKLEVLIMFVKQNRNLGLRIQILCFAQY